MEIWKDVPNSFGLYQISSMGNIRRVISDNQYRVLKQRIVKGYRFINLSIKGERKTVQVHRLVGQAFISNPNNHPCINHKDENPLNNHVDNLEWCTVAYNTNYGNCPAKISKAVGRPVQQIALNGQVIREYPSIQAAAIAVGVNRANISLVLNGTRKTSANSYWKLKNAI